MGSRPARHFCCSQPPAQGTLEYVAVQSVEAACPHEAAARYALAQRLQHPNVVAVLKYCVTPSQVRRGGGRGHGIGGRGGGYLNPPPRPHRTHARVRSTGL